MLPANTFEIKIEADGTLRIESGSMAGVAHQSADEFLKEVARLMGGAVVTNKVAQATHHHHHHHHDHSHEGGDHHH